MDPMTGVILVLLAVVFVIVLCVLGGSFFMVEQAQVVLVERFGRFARAARAGLNFKTPMIERKAGRLARPGSPSTRGNASSTTTESPESAKRRAATTVPVGNHIRP